MSKVSATKQMKKKLGLKLNNVKPEKSEKKPAVSLSHPFSKKLATRILKARKSMNIKPTTVTGTVEKEKIGVGSLICGEIII